MVILLGSLFSLLLTTSNESMTPLGQVYTTQFWLFFGLKLRVFIVFSPPETRVQSGEFRKYIDVRLHGDRSQWFRVNADITTCAVLEGELEVLF